MSDVFHLVLHFVYECHSERINKITIYLQKLYVYLVFLYLEFVVVLSTLEMRLATGAVL